MKKYIKPALDFGLIYRTVYKLGFGWVSVAAAMLLLSLAVHALCRDGKRS